MSRPESMGKRLWSSISEAGLVASGSDPMLAAASDPAYRFEPERLIEAFAIAVSSVHSVVVSESGGATVQLTPELLVDRARRCLEEPLVGSTSDAYRHMSRERLCEVLEGGVGEANKRGDRSVLLQGSPRLGNFRFKGFESAGFADWSMAAVGDRYFDLAIASRDLVEQMGPMALELFFDRYGQEPVDPVRLDWYSLAVELTTQSVAP